MSLLLILFILFCSPVATSSVENEAATFNEVQQGTFAVIGKTKNSFGQNYTINLRVTGSCMMGSCYVYAVEYATDSGYVSGVYQSVFGQVGTYTIYVNGQTYYFEF